MNPCIAVFRSPYPRWRIAGRAYLFCLICLSGIVALAAVGCGSGTVPERKDGSASNDSPAAPPAAVSLTAVDRAVFDKMIGTHRGRVVLVDFWATWCRPCVEQLPHTLELARRLADRGLSVVTVSCDDPSESERVAEFLRSQNATAATNLISQFGASGETMEVFEIAGGAVPYYQLYDRTGKLRQTFGADPTSRSQFSASDIDTAIEKLLRE